LNFEAQLLQPPGPNKILPQPSYYPPYLHPPFELIVPPELILLLFEFESKQLDAINPFSLETILSETEMAGLLLPLLVLTSGVNAT
jgi:hypothetical protein